MGHLPCSWIECGKFCRSGPGFMSCWCRNTREVHTWHSTSVSPTRVKILKNYLVIMPSPTPPLSITAAPLSCGKFNTLILPGRQCSHPPCSKLLFEKLTVPQLVAFPKTRISLPWSQRPVATTLQQPDTKRIIRQPTTWTCITYRCYMFRRTIAIIREKTPKILCSLKNTMQPTSVQAGKLKWRYVLIVTQWKAKYNSWLHVWLKVVKTLSSKYIWRQM